jgi:hypothetical protein
MMKRGMGPAGRSHPGAKTRGNRGVDQNQMPNSAKAVSGGEGDRSGPIPYGYLGEHVYSCISSNSRQISICLA